MLQTVKGYLGFGPPGEVLDNENAPYTVIKDFNGYEVREYPQNKWIATEGVGKKNNNMFWKLFNYIDGKNSRGDKIKMTVPVMISNVKKDSEMHREMAFFIPTQFQDAPPDPVDGTVKVFTRDPLVVYSKMMGGFPDFEAEAEKFKAELVSAGHTDVDFSMFYSAGYDAPFKLLNRRNEVMFKKISEPQP